MEQWALRDATYGSIRTASVPPISAKHCRGCPQLDVHLGNVESLDVTDTVQSEVPREGHGKVVTQGQELATLIRQVVDELRVLAVLPCKRL